MVQFHRSGEASGHQKMSGFCFLSHKWPIQAVAGSISTNSLPTWPALSNRQNGAFCLVASYPIDTANFAVIPFVAILSSIIKANNNRIQCRHFNERALFIDTESHHFLRVGEGNKA